MAKPREVKDNDFVKEVEQANGLVLVDFWAPWCGPCLMLAPVIEQLASEYAGRIKVVKLNVDENPETATRLQILSIPTLVLFKDGQPVERLVGAMPKDAIVAQLRKYTE